MSYTVHATIDGHRILAPAKTAKEAFVKAIEWHVAHQFADVVISDGNNDFTIAEFSSSMALSEIEAAQRVEKVDGSAKT